MTHCSLLHQLWRTYTFALTVTKKTIDNIKVFASNSSLCTADRRRPLKLLCSRCYADVARALVSPHLVIGNSPYNEFKFVMITMMPKKAKGVCKRQLGFT